MFSDNDMRVFQAATGIDMRTMRLRKIKKEQRLDKVHSSICRDEGADNETLYGI